MWPFNTNTVDCLKEVTTWAGLKRKLYLDTNKKVYTIYVT